MDFKNAVVRVLSMDEGLQSEEIEKILTEKYEYSLTEIEWMHCPEFRLILD
jgi:hypothetical protein